MRDKHDQPCYNTAMRVIFPLVLIIIGWALGGVVNFIIDGLYWKRGALSSECLDEIKAHGWFSFCLNPFNSHECIRWQRMRAVVINIMVVFFTLWLWYRPPQGVEFLWGLPLLMYLSVVTVMDLEHRVVLHEISLTGAVLGAALGISLHGLPSTLIGGVFGFGLMYLAYLLGVMYVRYRNRNAETRFEDDALGFGDVNISGVIGLILGWPGIIAGLVVGVVLGGLISLVYLVIRKLTNTLEMFEAIPYAPFLVAGAVILIYFRSIFL